MQKKATVKFPINNQVQAKNYMRSYILFLIGFMAGTGAIAQDSLNRRNVNVTSAFKPTLKEAAKINFTAAPPLTDTSRPRLQYEIPNQNLLFAFQPGSLRPVALGIDSVVRWDNWNYAKLGYGNFNTPYFETGLSLGDGQSAGLNIYGKHISSQGKRDFQDYSNTDVELNGFVQTNKNIEFTGRFTGTSDQYNRYGFDTKNFNFPEDSIKLRYNNFGVRLGFNNINRTDLGLSYAPEFRLDLFSDRLNNRETNAYFNLPLRKTLGGRFEAIVALDGNVTNYSLKGKKAIKNNYFSLAPAFLVRTTNVLLHAGIKPTWDNKEFVLLPDIHAEIGAAEKRVTLQVGYVGHMRSNTFRSLTEINPWIWAPNFSNNSRIREIFGGIKGTLTDHFSYNVKAGFNKITNQPFITNDTITGKAFAVMLEKDVNALNFTGELGYNVGEKFSLRTLLRLNKFTSLDSLAKPWGIAPMEFTTTLRLQLLKDLYLKGDLYAFEGPWYMKKSGQDRVQGSIDLSAGIEFAVVRNVKLWAQFNNILNREYERWHQYPTYGFNFLGGVVFSFAKPNK